jgi:hypothetical protein
MAQVPSLPEILTSWQSTISGEIRSVEPGRVTAFDRTTRLAQVQPVISDSNGDVKPVIPNCPVVFPGVAWDLQDDEEGLLLIGDLSFREWWRTGRDSAPEDQSLHDLSNAFFIAGVQSSGNVVTIPANDVYIPKATAGGDILIGELTATKAVVHDSLLTAMNAFLANFQAWGLAIDVAVFAVPGGSPTWLTLSAQMTAMINAIAAGNYESPSVKVED